MAKSVAGKDNAPLRGARGRRSRAMRTGMPTTRATVAAEAPASKATAKRGRGALNRRARGRRGARSQGSRSRSVSPAPSPATTPSLAHKLPIAIVNLSCDPIVIDSREVSDIDDDRRVSPAPEPTANSSPASKLPIATMNLSGDPIVIDSSEVSEIDDDRRVPPSHVGSTEVGATGEEDESMHDDIPDSDVDVEVCKTEISPKGKHIHWNTYTRSCKCSIVSISTAHKN